MCVRRGLVRTRDKTVKLFLGAHPWKWILCTTRGLVVQEAEFQHWDFGLVKQMAQFWLILAQSMAQWLWLPKNDLIYTPYLNQGSWKFQSFLLPVRTSRGLIKSFGELYSIDLKHLCFWKSEFYHFFITYTGSSAGLNAIYPAGHIDFDLGDQSIWVRDCVTSSYKDCQE